MRDDMMFYQLDREEALAIRSLACELQIRYRSVDNADFHEDFHSHIHKISAGLLSSLAKFRDRDVPFFRINGLVVHDELLKGTPENWRDRRSAEAFICEFMHFLIASHVGLPFCWKTQQEGRTINDILPVKGFEQEQLAIASRSHLKWHVEDAFHDARGEFLSLMCLRNHDRVPTLLSAPDMARLSPGALDELFRPQYYVRADDAHDVNNNLNANGALDGGLERAFEAAGSLRQIAILFGHRSRPYMRLDMDTFEREEFVSDAARNAYEELCTLVDAYAQEEICGAGDLLLVNNFMTIHGRPPFQPRYDGRDRWLQRLLLTTDFRKTAPFREHTDSTVLYA